MSDLPQQLRDLADTLESCEWNHPLNSAERCREAADALDRAFGCTADGVRFSNGSKAYYIDPCGCIQGLDVELKFQTDSSVPETVYHPYPVFSSREAAEKHKEEVNDE